MQEMQEMWLRSLDREDPLEKELTTHSGILAWEIQWTEEPGGYNPWGRKRIGHDLETKQQPHTYTHTHILATPCCMWDLNSPTRD